MSARPDRVASVHRAIRVSLASAAGFYSFLYGLDQPVTALYALFAPICLGVLAPIPGSGRQRAEVMVKAVPVALALVALGTVLAVRTWAAVAGMLVVGFLLAFAAVAGPRTAAVGPGLQLFYILACFPPYAPTALGDRLLGLTVGALLLVVLEVLLLPAAAPAPRARERLAGAADLAAEALTRPGAVPPAALLEAGRALRLSRLPPAERPAGPSRRERGLFQAGTAARRLLEQLAHLAGTDPPGAAPSAAAPPDEASAALLRQVADVCTTAATAVRTRIPPSSPEVLEKALWDFQRLRVRQSSGPGPGPGASVLRRQAEVMAVAESARILETAVRVGLDGRRTAALQPRQLFWYTDTSTPRLWAIRLSGHVTLRSVQFQNAVRIALGLGAARLVAGALDLDHGFWVLLAVLTLSRTTVGATWTAVRQAVLGNLGGAATAAALFIGVGDRPGVYAGVLAVGMLAAFALGQLLGIMGAQALFTLVVASAFAQIAPATWQLAEARVLDVVTGSLIGLLFALLAWPAGAQREVCRAMAALLRAAASLVVATTDVLLSPPRNPAPPAPSSWPALHRLRLAQAAYEQYRSEPGGEGVASRADWHAVLLVAGRVLTGAQWLPRFDLPATGVPPATAERLRAAAGRVAAAAGRVAALVLDEPPAPRPPPPEPAPADGTAPRPELIDLEVWLCGLERVLFRIEEAIENADGESAEETGSGSGTGSGSESGSGSGERYRRAPSQGRP